MGAEKKERKKSMSRTNRFGLKLAVHHVDRRLRQSMPGRRLQRNVAANYAAAVEDAALTLLLNASNRGKELKVKRITTLHLSSALNDPASLVHNVFPKNIPGLA